MPISNIAPSGSRQAKIERAVVNLLRFMDPPGALVFCNTRNAVRHMEAMLTERGFSSVALSGELSQSERNHALQALRDGRARVCVATDVAARGIDLPNLNLVIHAELPNDAQVLQHRSGRTGRAGRRASAYFWCRLRAAAAPRRCWAAPASRRCGAIRLRRRISASWTRNGCCKIPCWPSPASEDGSGPWPMRCWRRTARARGGGVCENVPRRTARAGGHRRRAAREKRAGASISRVKNPRDPREPRYDREHAPRDKRRASKARATISATRQSAAHERGPAPARWRMASGSG